MTEPHTAFKYFQLLLNWPAFPALQVRPGTPQTNLRGLLVYSFTGQMPFPSGHPNNRAKAVLYRTAQSIQIPQVKSRTLLRW